MISESGSVEAMLRGPGFPPFNNHHPPSIDHSRLDRLDPMQNQLCRCLMVGMSKSGSRYGRRSNWFKIHCLMQQNLQNPAGPSSKPMSPPMSSSASASSLSPNTPATMWSSPPKTEKPLSPDLREISPPLRSPEPSLKSGPCPTSTPSPMPIIPHPASHSPFKNLIPNLHPMSGPMLKPETSLPSPIPQPMTSLYGGFPSPLSLMSSVPGFPGIPMHKQALLSPLLAQTHLWQMARTNPLFSGLRPEVDLFAEHKALVERYSAAMAAAAAQQLPKREMSAESPISSPKREPSVSPTHSSAASEPAQHLPMDLSSKKGDDISDPEEDEDEEIVVKDEPSPCSPKADMNRNLVVGSRDSEKILDLCSK
ncbi:hypothetical protein TCAL_15979 [Tigriopus californicus]|uniref:Uncharacterized protein n=1 Tax=Tigriopus californicus TaxID=6832 RepID=A0A553PHG1_TIGCA|nr:hypothetical protein TCAL_15979 [Tigriopus californicus]